MARGCTPYTKILPKPLIPVGEQPIAELIMDRFRDFGCHDFTMIVNYKKGMIKSYFNELEKDYHVDFADEEVFMGTGGGLCLLKGKVHTPFFFSPTVTRCWMRTSAIFMSITRRTAIWLR